MTMPPEGTFYEIYDYYYHPFWTTRWFFVLVVIGIFFIMSLGGFFVYRFLQRRRQINTFLSPDEWAIRELNAVGTLPRNTKDEVRIFYFQLTGIIKVYFEKRYGFTFQQKTDEEVTQYVRQSTLAESLQHDLIALFGGAQTIKFAGQVAMRAQSKEDLARAHRLLQMTKQKQET